jgi:hypothetical protein
MAYFESNHPKSKVKTPRNFEKRGKLLSTLFLFLASQLNMLKRIEKKEGFLRVISPLGLGFESHPARWILKKLSWELVPVCMFKSVSVVVPNQFEYHTKQLLYLISCNRKS